MSKSNTNHMVQVYDKHKNLKIAAEELGMVWQTLYWNLKQINHPVIGDKEKYGSPTDKMAKELEDVFKKMVPFAKDLNEDKFQSPVDFDVKGYKVDVKCSTKKDTYKNNPNKNKSLRWAFCCKVQEDCSDFIVCYCMSGEDCEDFGVIEKLLLIPKEFYRNKQSLSVSCRKSKWYDFEIDKGQLLEFFNSLPDKI